MAENWTRAYREAPEIFDAFGRAEDPDGLIARRLLAHSDLAGRSVLEIGCGTGGLMAALAPHAGRYLGIEPEPSMLALAIERRTGALAAARLVRARAERLPVADRSTDRVVAAWVLIGLPPRRLVRVLGEASRVLKVDPAAGIWALESHWSGAFHELRGPRREVERKRIQDLLANHGFSCVEVVHTELRFPSAEEAERVLGYLCGSAARQRLLRRPRAVLSHHVMILHRSAEPR